MGDAEIPDLFVLFRLRAILLCLVRNLQPFWFHVEVVNLTKFSMLDSFICLIFICAFDFLVIILGKKDVTVQTLKVSQAPGLFE